MKRVLMVGTNKSWLERLEHWGDYDVWLYDSQESWRSRASWTAESSTLRGVELGPLEGADSLDKLCAWAEWLGVDAVIPGVESGVVFAAEVAEWLGTPGLSASAGRILTDKARLRSVCAGTLIAQPNWMGVRDLQLVEWADVPVPCVIKPSNQQASIGVSLVRRASDLENAIAIAKEAVSTSAECTPTFLVEELIDGTEYSAEVLVVEGRVRWTNVTRKHLAAEGAPVEVGHEVPGGIDQEGYVRLTAAISSLVRECGVETGVLHSEWIMREGVPFLVECAGRVPGDHILSLACDAWGFDVYAAILDALLGGPICVPEAPKAGAAIRYLTAEPGVVVQANLGSGLEGLGIEDARLFLDVGDKVHSLRSSWDRCGYVRTMGDSVREAVENAEKAVERLNFEVQREIRE